MQENSRPQQSKKPYERPSIKRFPLRPDEAVLGNCKVTGTSGASGNNCQSLGACRVIGS